MIFLNPAVLFGLIAVAIPLVLHLLNLRKLRTVEFSTLAFLKELQKSKMRRLKLRQILLLILRTLLIACLVLAFARPALRGTGVSGLGTHAKTTAVLLFDDSFSMTATDEHGSLLNQAKSVSLDVLSLLKEEDEVFFQRFSEGSSGGTTETPTHNISGVNAAVSETKVSMTFHTLGELLGRARKALKESRNFSKEIYLVTDLQKTNFAADEERATKSTESSSQQFESGTRLFLIPVGRASAENVAVDAVRMMNKVFEKDRPFSVEATIRNYGKAPLRNYTVSLYL
ncbi:MAG: BatA domain-containing protein, partial [Bacteroidota bacterium]